MKYILFVLLISLNFTNSVFANVSNKPNIKNTPVFNKINVSKNGSPASAEVSFYNRFLVHAILTKFSNVTDEQRKCFINNSSFYKGQRVIKATFEKNFTEDERIALREFFIGNYSFFEQRFLELGYTPEQTLQALKEQKETDYISRKFTFSNKELEQIYQKATFDLEKAISDGILLKANSLFASTNNFQIEEKRAYDTIVAQAKIQCKIK